MEIKLATLPQVIAVAYTAVPAFNEEFGHDGVYSFDKDDFLLSWIDWLRSPSHAMFVCFDKTEFIGFICGEVYTHPFNSKQIIGRESAWYVAKKHRASTVGGQLLDTFEEWAKSNGANLIEMMFMKNSNPAGLFKFYSKRGYNEAETMMVKGV